MNCLLLTLLKKLLHIKSSVTRIVLAAGVGGVGAVITLFLPMPFFLRFLWLYLIISGCMVRIAYPYKGIQRLLIQVGELYILAFFLGGFFQFLYYQMNLELFFQEKKIHKLLENQGAGFLIKGSVIFLLIFPFFNFYWNKKKDSQVFSFDVKLTFREKSIEGIGLLDTGNHLREPYSGKPVHLCEFQWAKELLTKEEAEMVKQYKNLDVKARLPFPIYVIPFHSVGREKGILYGIKMDELIVSCQEDIRKENDIIVALCENSLGADNTYQMILHAEGMKTWSKSAKRRNRNKCF